MLLAMPADRSVPAGGDDVGQRLRDQGKAVIGFRPQRASARVWKQLEPRSPARQLFVFPQIATLEEILLIPRTRTPHDKGWRIVDVRHAKNPGGIPVERRIAHRMLPSRLSINGGADIVF